MGKESKYTTRHESNAMEFLGKMLYFDTSLVFISCLVDLVSMKISQPMVDDWERWATNPKVIPPLESNDWDRDQYQLLQLVKIFHIPTIHKFSSDVPQVEHLQTTVSFFFGENFCWWISGTHINLFCVHPDQNLLRLIHQHASLRNDYVYYCSCSPWKQVVMWYL